MTQPALDQSTEFLRADLKRRLQDLYGNRLANLWLFGSRARQDAESGSDIDILVVLRGLVDPNEERERTLDMIAEISLENDAAISCLFMDEEYFVTKQGPLLRNIRREGVLL
ncbi:MAG TPA: nucleotidyltransferase domain-containing protein [bacterium]|nr:nucleotidyltransferase domain-containing protein [bacterium]HQO35458.1 nucleotidyltransferase domain-containing protein [bacterium]HQP97580.1 nucleotidyltransferase domain-containing protein [bacterium]